MPTGQQQQLRCQLQRGDTRPQTRKFLVAVPDRLESLGSQRPAAQDAVLVTPSLLARSTGSAPAV
jgi:hypothetical protein